MGYDPEARAQARQDRLGPDARCVLCGESDTRCLERHHVAGQHFANTLVVVCRNCHRKLSDDQRDHPPPSAADPPLLERFAHWLMGVADLLQDLADAMRAWGKLLLRLPGADVPVQSLGGDPDE